MALGYAGYVKVGGIYALGTGTAVPRARTRLESSSGYGGRVKTPVNEIGIGTPRNYDWEVFDGSLSYEITKDIFSLLKAWVLDRESQNNILISPRVGSSSAFSETYWNSISISAGEGAAVEGSLGFVAMVRDSYGYGTQGLNDEYALTPQGQNLICHSLSGFPDPLNKDQHNFNPIPFWNTSIILDSDSYDFLTWTLDFSQDVVKFFACNHNAGPQQPAYVGVGPMTITLSGTWMWIDPTMPASFPADSITAAKVNVADTSISFGKLELTSISDDVQSPDSTTPVSMEYAVYEVEST